MAKFRMLFQEYAFGFDWLGIKNPMIVKYYHGISKE